MQKEEFERFKEQNLIFFKNRYKIKNSRKELKESVFNNPSLTEPQKTEFWTLVTKKDLLKSDEKEELEKLVKVV